MKKRILTMLMATTMLATAFVGCGKEETPTTGGDVTEESGDTATTISMLFCDSATEPYTVDWKVLDLIEEATGVTFDMTVVPSADFTAKRELIFNSGNIPDIVAHTFVNSGWVSSGLLLPISAYEDRMPNYQAWIEETGYRDIIDDTRFVDGNYYGLPVKAADYIVQEVMWLVRTDIFEKHELEIPTNYEELLSVGKELLELYPGSTPITNRFTSNHIYGGLSSMFGAAAGWNYSDGMVYDFEKDEWFFTATTDEYKNFVSFTRDLYESGVLDQEFSTLESTVYEQKVVTGDTFILFDWASNIMRYNQQGQAIDENFNISPIYPIEGTDGNYGISRKNGWVQSYVFPASLAKDEKQLDAVLKYLDWGFTEEAQTLLTFGVEGEHYEVVDGTKVALSGSASADWGVNNNELCIRQDLDVILGVFTPEDRAVFEAVAADGIIPRMSPQAPLTTDQLEETAIYTTALTDYVKAMTDKFIMGEESLDNWDKFVAECVAKGSEKLAAEYAEAMAAVQE